MIPSPDRFSGDNDAGSFSGGGSDQRPPADSGDIPFSELWNFHHELCPIVQQWITKKPPVEALEKLVEACDRLFRIIYPRYCSREEEGDDSSTLLEKLADQVCLVAFSVGDMRDAGGKISSEDRLKLFKHLLELDGALELMLGIPGEQ